MKNNQLKQNIKEIIIPYIKEIPLGETNIYKTEMIDENHYSFQSLTGNTTLTVDLEIIPTRVVITGTGIFRHPIIGDIPLQLKEVNLQQSNEFDIREKLPENLTFKKIPKRIPLKNKRKSLNKYIRVVEK